MENQLNDVQEINDFITLLDAAYINKQLFIPGHLNDNSITKPGNKEGWYLY